MQEDDSNRQLLGRYEIGRLLGYGAFAKVYHARDLNSGNSLAIKVIKKNRLSSYSQTKREISIMSRLHHPNIVRLHEVLATKTKIFFVMEYLKGGELFDLVQTGRLSEERARRYFRQLISAVGYCHSRGVFHRDLKPDNLLLDSAGNLKVTDFGLSVEQTSSDVFHTLCGTPAYVAPEILAKKGYRGSTVDVWSCGVILFVLVAGYLPFHDTNLINLYRKIYHGHYSFPEWMSDDLQNLLSRMFDVNPETRITIDGILKDGWFNKGSSSLLNFSGAVEKPDEVKSTSLNAFDLISFSSGLDLSNLFETNRRTELDWERVVSMEQPELVMKRIESFAVYHRLGLRNKSDVGVLLLWPNGTLSVDIKIRRLTNEAIVVEAKRRTGDSVAFWEAWKSNIRQMLNGSNDLSLEKKEVGFCPASEIEV